MDGIIRNKSGKYELSKEKRKELFKKYKLYYLVISSVVPRNVLHTYFMISFIFIHMLFLVVTLYYTVMVEENMEIAAESLYFLLVLLISLFFLFRPIRKRELVNEILTYIAKGIYTYEDTIDPVTMEIINDIKTKGHKKQKLYVDLLDYTFNIFGILCLILFPILNGKWTSGPDPVLDDLNILRRAPITAWTPYDNKHWLGFSFAIFTEYLIALDIVWTLVGTDISFIGFFEELSIQLDVLIVTLKHSIRRSRYVYEKKFGKKPSTEGDANLDICIRMCLKDSIKHHNVIDSLFELTRDVYSLTNLIVFLAGALLLCISGVILMSSRVSYVTKGIFLTYLVQGLIHYFIYAYYGEKIKNQTWDIRQSVYDMDWTGHSKVLKPYITMITLHTNTPLLISAAGLITCDYSSFSNVMSSAYSYFNLLRASTEF